MLVNDELQAWERKKDIKRGVPVERTHGEIIILPLTDSTLFRKIIKRIEMMRGIKYYEEMDRKTTGLEPDPFPVVGILC